MQMRPSCLMTGVFFVESSDKSIPCPKDGKVNWLFIIKPKLKFILGSCYNVSNQFSISQENFREFQV